MQASIPLFLGLFSGWIAARIARKTPHENLKALVEIKAALDPTIDTDGAIDESIRLELKRLNQIAESAKSDWRPYLWVRIVNNIAVVSVASFVVVGFALFVVAINRVVGPSSGASEENDNSDILWAVVGVVVAAVVVLAATYASYRRDRALLLD